MSVANSRNFKLYLKVFKQHFIIHSIRQDALYGNMILRQSTDWMQSSRIQGTVLRKCCLEQPDFVNVYYLRYKLPQVFFCGE